MNSVDVFRSMLNLSSSIDNISNTTIFYGSLTVSSNLIVNNLLNIPNLTTMNNKLKVSSTSYINSISNNNSLYIYGNCIIPTITSASSFNISNTSILKILTSNTNMYISAAGIFNTMTCKSNLYISGGSIINNVVTNNLYVNGNTIIPSLTISSQLYSNNCICNILTVNSILNSQYLTQLNNNTTVISNIITSNYSYIKGICTIKSNINITNTAILNSSLYSNNITVANVLSVSGATKFKNIYASSISFIGIKKYDYNINAINNGLITGQYYRTDNILKVCTDTIAPVITISGNSLISILKGQPYIEIGISAIDNIDSPIIPYITSIAYNNTNYLPNSIRVYQTSISALNTSLIGYHTITYTATDSYNNSSTAMRVISVINDTVSPIVTLIGPSTIQLKINTPYIEYGVTVTDNLGENIIPVITSNVNTSIPGKYIVQYTATDLSGNTSTQNRTVYVYNVSSLPSYIFDVPSFTYLYIVNNYNKLITSQFWTIECWAYITNLTNGCTIIDFREKPFVQHTGKFSLIINSSGYIGINHGTLGQQVLSLPQAIIQLNIWTHIACQRNGIYLEFYLNGLFVGKMTNGNYFTSTYLNNFNQLTLGMLNSQLITDSANHLKGSLSQVKISVINKYKYGFVPLNNLSPSSTELSTVLFYLSDNYIDTISNTTMISNSLPVINTMDYYISLPIVNIEQSSLLFNLQVSQMPVTNTTWVDATGKYNFIIHPNANNYNSIIKIQNNNGWKRSLAAGWVMTDTSHNVLKNQTWANGLTLECWIFIDHDFIPTSDANTLLVGQSSMFLANEYGFGFCQTNYSSTIYNVLSFFTSTYLSSQGTGAGTFNLNLIRGSWSHITMAFSSNIFNIYINGGLIISLSNTEWTAFPNPSQLSSKFAIGCQSVNGSMQVESISKIYFGNIRLYNRQLNQDEINNNYKYELPLYNTPTNDIYYSTVVGCINNNAPTYDVTNGYLLSFVDTNILRSCVQWTIEAWVYATSWGTSNDSGYIIDFGSVNNTTSIFSIGVTSDNTNITPSISYDGKGRPFIYYKNDTAKPWKISSAITVPLYQWVHIAYQRNNDTTLEMYVNGTSCGTFTIDSTIWGYTQFCTSGLNRLLLGGSYTSPSSITNHWKGSISQPKITLNRSYTGNFVPSFNLYSSNSIFLLDDNYRNGISGKIQSYTGTVSLYSPINISNSITGISIILNGSQNSTLYSTMSTYTELAFNIQYPLRTQNIISTTIGTVNSNIPSLYSISYCAIDTYLNIFGYNKRFVNVTKYSIPPVITLNGFSKVYLKVGTTYTEQGVTITNSIGDTITPVINSNVNSNVIGQYNIIYTATDRFGNSSTVTRYVYVVNMSINDVYFWIDPSFTETITVDTSNNISAVKDMSSTNSVLGAIMNTPTLDYNIINGLPIINLSNSAMRTPSTYPNSINITLSIIVMITQQSPNGGGIWGHFPNTGSSWDTNICLRNVPTSNYISWHTSSNSNVKLLYTNLVPYLYTCVLSNGTFRYLKQINLLTGETNTSSGTNTISITLQNGNIWLGSTNISTTYFGCYYLGECMYWKRILSSLEIYNIETYLFNKWADSSLTFNYVPLLPTISLNGSTPYYIPVGGTYTEMSATITSILDTSLVLTTSGTINNNIAGDYIITYSTTNTTNNIVSITRIIKVVNLSEIPILSFDTQIGNIQLTNLNFNSINNNDWTFEAWINMYNINTSSSNSFGYGSTIVDFRSPGTTTTPAQHMWMSIDDTTLKPRINIYGTTNIFTINKSIDLGKWCHVVWMRYNSKLYSFINGVCSSEMNLLSSMNNFTQLTYINFGVLSNYVNNGTTIYHFIGQICQPQLTKIAKYNISGFNPIWYLQPLDTTNTLFWLNYDIDIISNQSLVKNSITQYTYNSNQILPILILKSTDKYYMHLNDIYIEYGVICKSYISNSDLSYTITSIKNQFNKEFLTSPIIASDVSNYIDTTAYDTYNIVYTTKDNLDYTNTIIRQVSIVDTIQPITFNLSNGWIGPITYNFNVLTTSLWTIESWIYLLSYSALYQYIFKINNFGLIISNNKIGVEINSTQYYTSTIALQLNSWIHIAWMFNNTNLYVFINGIMYPIIITTTDITTMTNLDNLCIGYSSNNFTGIICQPSIRLDTKYSTNFTPLWDLFTDKNNIIFWTDNLDSYTQKSILPFNNLVSYTRLTSIPVLPILVLNGNSAVYLNYGSTYTDSGVTLIYPLENTSIPYIISILRNDNTEMLNTPINISQPVTIPNSILYTSMITFYTITYSITTLTGSTTVTRKVYTTSMLNYYNISGNNTILFNGYNFSTLSSGCTIEFWINPSAYTTTDFIYFIKSGDTIGSSYYYVILFDSSQTKNNNSGTASTLFSTSILTLNSWNHIAYTFSSNILTTWVNGVNKSQITDTNITNIFNLGTNLTLYVGRGLSSKLLEFSILKYVKYTIAFTPSMDLIPSNYTNSLLFLSDNSKELISNTTLTLTNITLGTYPFVPIMELLDQQSTEYIQLNSTYNEKGVKCINYLGVPLTYTITGSVDATKVGSYTLIYSAGDSNGYISLSRTVIVKSITDYVTFIINDWKTRIQTAGGTVSTQEETAHYNFVNYLINNNNAWSKLLRINTFCGSNLNAALCPIKNNSGFDRTINDTIQTNTLTYNRTGGIAGNGSGSLNTGIKFTSWSLDGNNLHMGFYAFTAIDQRAMGVQREYGYTRHYLISDVNYSQAAWGGLVSTNSSSNSIGLNIIQRRSGEQPYYYRNNVKQLVSGNIDSSVPSDWPCTLFGSNGSIDGTNPGNNIYAYMHDNSNTRSGGYTIGYALSDSQINDLNSAFSTLNTALSRS